MIGQSNIAIDIAHCCERLAKSTDVRGGEFLAGEFGVEEYSPEFFEILTIITSTVRSLEGALAQSELHPALVQNATMHLRTIREAFNRGGLGGPWKNHGFNSVSALHSDPILTLSGSLPHLNYAKPTDAELADILSDAKELLEWLVEHEIEESDFIRLCIIDGLRRFIFRVQKTGWLGWPSVAGPLREIIGAYLALERGIDGAAPPLTEAFMRKVMSKLATPLKFVTGAREVSDDAAFLLSVYKGVAAPGLTFIAGYLTG